MKIFSLGCSGFFSQNKSGEQILCVLNKMQTIKKEKHRNAEIEISFQIFCKRTSIKLNNPD